MIFIAFLILATIIVLGSIQLSKQAEIIEVNSTLNAVVVGSILAFATSLPELATGITSTFLGQGAMSISNVLGSNAFNILILALMNIIFYKETVYSKIDSKANKTNYFTFLMYVLFVMSLVLNSSGVLHFGRIDLTSIFIVIVYVLAMKSVSGPEEEAEATEEVEHSKEAFKKAVVKFALLAVVILVTSILLSKVAELIMIQTGLSASFVGAIFIGISTSLPELVTCTTLVKSGSYNMAASGVLGSNLFNFVILSVVDVFDAKPLFMAADGGIYTMTAMGMTYLLLTIIAIKLKINNKFANLVLPILMIGSYLMYVVMGA